MLMYQSKLFVFVVLIIVLGALPVFASDPIVWDIGSRAEWLKGEDVKLWDEIYVDEGVRWLYSFLSADKHRSYCLYEAPSPDAIIAAAERAGLPADVVTEVTRVTADTFR